MKVQFLDLKPMHDQVRGELSAAFERVVDSGWFIQGKELRQFEDAYSAFNTTRHAVGVSNGLDALQLALAAAGVACGDEVLVPANSFIATAFAVTHLGATPVLVEPDPQTHNVDPARLEEAITERTRAVVPVHLFGQACRMDAIMAVADKHGLAVVEDNAQAHGADFAGKRTGSWGAANATSFYPGKNLGALGDGGAVTTDDDAIASRIRQLRSYGSSEKYVHELVGRNMRLDEMQAAFLQAKLARLDEWTRARRRIAERYTDALSRVGDLELPVVADGATHVWHLYVLRTARRDALKQHLAADGVETLIHYPIPIHLQAAYAPLGHRRGSFPVAEQLAETSLSLPIWPGMSAARVDHVCASVGRFFGA